MTDCRCGHSRACHEHYRPGTDCARAQCDCRRYRRGVPLINRKVEWSDLPDAVKLRWRINHARYELGKYQEKLLISIAWHMPRKIVYWCAIRLLAEATTGKYSSQVVPELLAMDALRRWGAR